MHQNYYEDYMPSDEVQSGIDDAKAYLRELELAQTGQMPDVLAGDPTASSPATKAWGLVEEPEAGGRG